MFMLTCKVHSSYALDTFGGLLSSPIISSVASVNLSSWRPTHSHHCSASRASLDDLIVQIMHSRSG